MKPVAVIPSRYASVRFPGKPLALLCGKPMVQHVYDRCVESGAFDRILIATDDERIAESVRRFGGEVAMTSPQCQSGTDRVAEVARALPDAEVVVNVQGDEPLIAPVSLKALAELFDDPSVEMATLVRPLEENERANPNVVKVVRAENGDALYFSRADIPFDRDAQLGGSPAGIERLGHIGIYGYRREVLARIAALPPHPLELSERLEQLRALAHGVHIRCAWTRFTSIGVDTPEDLKKAEALLRTRS
ncbi:MAG: 3-deoxy-manno-octulosonate cytidylyltransferase [Myxococcaceae bacterium]|nr:3-deoxy-manno-octulosonate cytidylyltransferase [Myxococcaceae bacterium]